MKSHLERDVLLHLLYNENNILSSRIQFLLMLQFHLWFSLQAPDCKGPIKTPKIYLKKTTVSTMVSQKTFSSYLSHINTARKQELRTMPTKNCSVPRMTPQKSEFQPRCLFSTSQKHGQRTKCLLLIYWITLVLNIPSLLKSQALTRKVRWIWNWRLE